MSDTGHDSHDADIERRARQAFDASVDGLDAVTQSRLNRSRQQALEAVRSRRGFGQRWWTNWAPAGALAAAVLVAVLLLRSPTEIESPDLAAGGPADETQQDPLELLAAGEDLDLATEADLDFYVWVELETADDGVG